LRANEAVSPQLIPNEAPGRLVIRDSG